MKQLRKDFPTDQACLEFAFDALHSRECSCGGTYAPVKGRKQFYCSKCRFQLAPLAGTIMHKSDTPLTLWFHALWVFSNAKSGVSAKELERQLAVTYKCSWRILTLIRKAYVRGDVHANTIDGFWSHIKRSINGTHKVVSKKHLQEYLNAFVFHRNNGGNDKERFFALLRIVMQGATA